MINSKLESQQVVALSGGVGGAKLVDGLYRILDKNRLNVIVNTADDFEHLGLFISPDLDTVLYTLAGLSSHERGWGRENETWNFMNALRELNDESWFQLGDKDLALHTLRTQWLAQGGSLTGFAGQIATILGIQASVLPATDQAIKTIVTTDTGTLSFQEYFVRERCVPAVRALRYDQQIGTTITLEIRRLLSRTDIQAIVLCPSNPYLSIDPILAVPEMRKALLQSSAPIIAVSPLVGGKAVKGPTDKLMQELGFTPSHQTIVEHYGQLLDGIVVHNSDSARLDCPGVQVLATNTLMLDLNDRCLLAQDVLAFSEQLVMQKKHRQF